MGFPAQETEVTLDCSYNADLINEKRLFVSNPWEQFLDSLVMMI